MYKPSQSRLRHLIFHRNHTYHVSNNLITDPITSGKPTHTSQHPHLRHLQLLNVGILNYNNQFKNLGKLVGELKKEILTKYTCSNSSTQTSSSEKGGLNDQPNVERQPDYPYQPAGSFPSVYVVPPIPGTVGGGDLFPGPGAGVYPTRGGPGPGGSMQVGPNDARFFGGMSGDPRLAGGLPTGACFDPYGPPDVPGFEPVGRGRPHPDDLPNFGGDSDFI